jgi:hypothetical protein
MEQTQDLVPNHGFISFGEKFLYLADHRPQADVIFLALSKDALFQRFKGEHVLSPKRI